MPDLFHDAKKLMPILSRHRRWLHAHPGVAFDLGDTLAHVRTELEALGLSPVPCGRAGLTAVIGSGTPCILLRADMDALPIPEESGEAFASANGCMHACGHDLHTAMLLGAAQLLKAREAELEGTVRLMFQPAEEIFEGAKDMIEAGVLESPAPGAALMLHVTVGAPLPAGTVIAMAPGVSASAADYFTIRIQGRGCHGSTPHLGIDAITASAHTLLALQELHARELAPGTEAVLTVGTIRGGTAANAIADSCTLEGTIRTFDEGIRSQLKERLQAISSAVASAYRAAATVEFGSGAPTLVNDADLARAVPGASREILPADMVLSAADFPAGSRAGGSEDFAYVSQKVPTLMLALAAGSSADGYTHPLHHPTVRLDENAMPFGAAALAHTAMRWLETVSDGTTA